MGMKIVERAVIIDEHKNIHHERMDGPRSAEMLDVTGASMYNHATPPDGFSPGKREWPGLYSRKNELEKVGYASHPPREG
jgi:hypothetical protein